MEFSWSTSAAVAVQPIKMKYCPCSRRTSDYVMSCRNTNYSSVQAHLTVNWSEVSRVTHSWSMHCARACVGWSKPELLAGIPDGKGGYLPAIKQSPMGATLPNGMNNEPPPLNKSFSGARVASTPFILQQRTQTPTSPFLSRPTSHSSVSCPMKVNQH